MAKQRVPAEQLAAAVDKILKKYGDDVRENLAEIGKSVVKAGVRELKSQSSSTFDGTGKYASGWTSKFETGRLSSQGIIYNGDVPGLPHLLEHGHANRGGGRTPGRIHIATVEEALVKEFESKVKSKL